MSLLLVVLSLVLFYHLSSARIVEYNSHVHLIDAVNARASSWKAGYNQLPRQLLILDKVNEQPENRLPVTDPDEDKPIRQNALTDELPENFDGRVHWPECPSLTTIREQGCCGSCYAVAAVSAMTDRWCIQSNGTEHFYFSAIDVITCCKRCGDCSEGFPASVWRLWLKDGIVSGGEYNSSRGCKPYQFDECKTGQNSTYTPSCHQECRLGYSVSYEDDKRYGKRAYHVYPLEASIMRNLYHNGPVSATFSVFTDFLSYKSGVYQHLLGRKLGVHVVKVIGWGVEQGTNYWLVANSWGLSWGDQGFFKILRGENHLGFESEVFGGIPKFLDE